MVAAQGCASVNFAPSIRSYRLSSSEIHYAPESYLFKNERSLLLETSGLLLGWNIMFSKLWMFGFGECSVSDLAMNYSQGRVQGMLLTCKSNCP